MPPRGFGNGHDVVLAYHSQPLLFMIDPKHLYLLTILLTLSGQMLSFLFHLVDSNTANLGLKGS